MTAPWPHAGPRPPAPAPAPRRRRWPVHVAWAVACLVSLFVGVGLVVNTEERPYGSQREAWSAGRTAGESAGYRSGFAAASRPTVTTGSVPTTAAPAQPAPPAPPAQSFTAGTRRVGDGPGEIPAGSYRTGGNVGYSSSSSCYWARLSGTGGTLDDIIANERITGGASSIMTVRPSDAAVQFRGPCTWVPDES